MDVDKDLALLYGILLGDGCISKVGKNHHFVEICGHLEDDLPFLNNIKPIVERIRSKKVRIKKRPSQGKLEMGFCDKKMFLLFKNIGFPVGKKGKKLKISSFFGEKYYREIIKGYFATDGCLVLTNNNGIIYPRIEFSSISKVLLKQVLDYLKKEGIQGSLYVSHKYENNWNNLYRIQFNGKNNLEKFIEKIGFTNPKHKKKYEKWKKNGGAEI